MRYVHTLRLHILAISLGLALSGCTLFISGDGNAPTDASRADIALHQDSITELGPTDGVGEANVADANVGEASAWPADGIADVNVADVTTTDLPPPTPRPPPRGTCNAAGWCWVNPLPQGNDLYQAYFDAKTQTTFVVGAKGTILRSTKTLSKPWEAVNSDSDSLLTGIWNNKNIWVTGPATGVRSLDGASTSWTSHSGRGNQIWGVSDNNLWAASSGSDAQHYDGSAWTSFSLLGGAKIGAKTIFGLHGSGTNDIWAVGESGFVSHWDGAAWSVITSNTSHALYDVALDTQGVWVAGAQGTVLHNNLPGSHTLVPMASPLPSANDLYGIWGNGTQRWVVGGGGKIFRYDSGSATWATEQSPTTLALRDVIGTESTLLAVGQDGVMLRRTGNSWDFDVPASPTRVDLHAVRSNGAHDLWLIGAGATVVHWNGVQWKTLTVPQIAPDTVLRAMWGNTSAGVWIVGDRGTILHWDGKTTRHVASGTMANLNAIWGASPTDIFAVGEGGIILHYDGTQWTSEPSSATVSSLNAIWGTPGISTPHPFAVGTHGAILTRRSGPVWEPVQPTTLVEDLHAIWGTSKGNVWIAGDKGTFLVYDGLSTFLSISGTTNQLLAIGTDGSNAVVTSSRGEIFRLGNGSLKSLGSPTSKTLRATHWDGTSLWVVGDRGTVITR